MSYSGFEQCACILWIILGKKSMVYGFLTVHIKDVNYSSAACIGSMFKVLAGSVS